MKVVAIIQARMGSTRLPGKVMKDLAGDTVLARVVSRTRRSRLLDEVVIATTDKVGDDVIVRECERIAVPVFRGDEADVLDRYYRAAQKFSAEAIVRITSDCPLTDPELVDQHVRRLIDRWDEVDFVTNMSQQSYPLGLAVEALPMDVLTRMHRLSDTPELKEHVTTMAYAEPRLFRIDNICHSEDLSQMRWTVDTREDLELVRLIFKHFGTDDFSWGQILPLLDRHPEWVEINRHIPQKIV
jgi:spore coat polysaccharide biosynthesis protein SpsF